MNRSAAVLETAEALDTKAVHLNIHQTLINAMRSVMWHKDQKSACALVLAIVNEAQTL